MEECRIQYPFVLWTCLYVMSGICQLFSNHTTSYLLHFLGTSCPAILEKAQPLGREKWPDLTFGRFFWPETPDWARTPWVKNGQSLYRHLCSDHIGIINIIHVLSWFFLNKSNVTSYLQTTSPESSS